MLKLLEYSHDARSSLVTSIVEVNIEVCDILLDILKFSDRSKTSLSFLNRHMTSLKPYK